MSNFEELLLGSEFPQGLDFQSDVEFDDPGLIAEVLCRLRLHIDDKAAIAYCLRLVVKDDTSWFVPYSQTGLVATSVKLPDRIETKRVAGIDENWPPAAFSLGFPNDSIVTDQGIRQSAWNGKIRLMVGNRHVGYCKIVIPAGHAIPSKDDFRECIRQVAIYLQERIAGRQSLRMLRSKELIDTTSAVDADLKAGAPIAALGHLLMRISSHFGANVNRIACFGERSPGSLECLFSLGGDGTPAWAENVQKPIGEIRSPSDLHDLAKLESIGSQDPYRQALLAPSPFRIDVNEPDCLLAKIWRKRCELDWLPPHQALEYRESNFAARFNDQDPWARRIAAQDRFGILFAAQNKQYFALPWRTYDRPIGVLLCDFGYWIHIDVWRDAVPRLLKARALLAYFAGRFGKLAARGWS